MGLKQRYFCYLGIRFIFQSVFDYLRYQVNLTFAGTEFFFRFICRSFYGNAHLAPLSKNFIS